MRDPVLAAISKAEDEGRLADARKLLIAGIHDAERISPGSPRLSLLLNYLADLDFRQDRYQDAIATSNRALALDRELYGPESPRVAHDLNNFGIFNEVAGNESAAEKAFEEALKLARQNPGPRSQTLLMVLNNLSSFYGKQKRTVDAENLLNEAMQLCESNPGPRMNSCESFRGKLVDLYRIDGHANAAEGIASDAVVADLSSNRQWHKQVIDLQTLAQQYEKDNAYDLAEETYRQALALREKNTRPGDPDDPVALMEELNRLGELLVKEDRNSEAEDLFKRALEMQVQGAGPKRPDLAGSFNFDDLGNLYRAQGRLADLEPMIQQVLALQERVLGAQHKEFAETLLMLAEVYREEGKYADAEPAYRRALEIQETNLGADDPHLIVMLTRYAGLLQLLNEPEQANAFFARAAALRQKLDAQNKK